MTMIQCTFVLSSPTTRILQASLKSLPSTSGRFDVLARAWLAAIRVQHLCPSVSFRFLLSFVRDAAASTSTAPFRYHLELPLLGSSLPKSEIMAASYLLDYLQVFDSRSEAETPPHFPVTIRSHTSSSFFKLIQDHEQIFLLEEDAPFFSLFLSSSSLSADSSVSIAFLIGNQKGIDPYLFEVPLSLTPISLGPRSYLASQVLLLIGSLLSSHLSSV